MKCRELLVLVILSSILQASAAERYQLKEDTKLFGFIPGHTKGNAEYVIPFDRAYEQLSVAQQRVLKSAYVEMGESDEPPFPVGGLKTLYGPITEGQQSLLTTGTFAARAEIDADGNAVAVAVYRSPSKAVTNFVSNIILLTKFKPAVCGGSACKMGFPVRISFDVR
jgi:hypothetical protein